MRVAINRFNDAHGNVSRPEGGYHETITQASIAGARAFLAGQPADLPLRELLAHLLASPLGDKDWSLIYWRRETLFSPDARRGWIAPDLAPLPWAVPS